MNPRRRHPALVLVCLLVAVSFGWAFLHASTFHTDEDSHNELDCFACHLTSAGTGIVTLAITHLPDLVEAGDTVSFELPLPIDIPSPATTSRGPPSAA
jgi:hypothetical protein